MLAYTKICMNEDFPHLSSALLMMSQAVSSPSLFFVGFKFYIHGEIMTIFNDVLFFFSFNVKK